jgi:hypothetical protein
MPASAAREARKIIGKVRVFRADTEARRHHADDRAHDQEKREATRSYKQASGDHPGLSRETETPEQVGCNAARGATERFEADQCGA